MGDTASGTSFVVTDEMLALNSNLLFGLPLAGACLSFLVLAVIAGLYTLKRTREQLDRVSFRLLIGVLCGNLIYGTCFAIIGKIDDESLNQRCKNSMFLLMFGLQFSSFLTCSIAMNLELVINHGFNGKNIEKFYYIAAAVFGLALSATSFGAGMFGYDSDFGSCWWFTPDEASFIAWQMGDEVAWTLFLALIEFGLFLSISRSLLKTRNQMKFARNGARSAAVLSYRNIILRVGLYPVAGICINTLTGFANIYLVREPTISSQEIWNIQLMNSAVYGLRPCVYPILAMFDPSLIRAISSLVRNNSSLETTNLNTSLKHRSNGATVLDVHEAEESFSKITGDDSDPVSGTKGDLQISYPSSGTTIMVQQPIELVKSTEMKVQVVRNVGNRRSAASAGLLGDAENQIGQVLTRQDIEREGNELGKHI